jgi:predicted metal-dependent HD superfamily phosphohydrolase
MFADRMNTGRLLSDIEKYIEGLFSIFNNPYLLYHNLEHSRQVVKHAKEISTYYSLDDESTFTVLAAAWFHDIGHLMGYLEGHEEAGVQIMKEVLKENNIDEKIINSIASCIMATKSSNAPTSLMQQIICDADTYHVGTSDFWHLDSMVWKEMELRLGTDIKNKTEHSLHFLEKHQFQTGYCQQLLSAEKAENISQLKKLL